MRTIYSQLEESHSVTVNTKEYARKFCSVGDSLSRDLSMNSQIKSHRIQCRKNQQSSKVSTSCDLLLHSSNSEPQVS